ncbi:hypothetical protein [Chryseobacterium sp.]|uniref:hypothetical protein n=1 Tax=Chryseobacterium sp. TaxID=1871047 RepID=UPI00289A7199|nr:hypothetical protein [Chryseobacterium sp.]
MNSGLFLRIVTAQIGNIVWNVGKGLNALLLKEVIPDLKFSLNYVPQYYEQIELVKLKQQSRKRAEIRKAQIFGLCFFIALRSPPAAKSPDFEPTISFFIRVFKIMILNHRCKIKSFMNVLH